MKVKLLTMLLGLLFLSAGASFVRAELPLSSENSVKLPESARINGIRLRIGTVLKMKCTSASADCAQLLSTLQSKNTAWESCSAGGGDCSSEEAELVAAGNAYNNAGCTPENARYIDRKKFINRNDGNG